MPLISVTEEELALIQKLRASARLGQTLQLGPAVESPTKDLMGRFRRLLGDEDMERDAGKWRNRVNQWPRRVEALLMNLEQRIADGQPVRRPAAYAEHMWAKYCSGPETSHA